MACADLERFVRGGHTLTTSLFFMSSFYSWGEGGSIYLYKRVIIGTPAKRHINGVSLACQCWPNIECWLGSFVIFRWSEPVLLKNSIFLWLFRGVRTPCPHPHPLDPGMCGCLSFASLSSSSAMCWSADSGCSIFWSYSLTLLWVYVNHINDLSKLPLIA